MSRSFHTVQNDADATAAIKPAIACNIARLHEHQNKLRAAEKAIFYGTLFIQYGSLLYSETQLANVYKKKTVATGYIC